MCTCRVVQICKFTNPRNVGVFVEMKTNRNNVRVITGRFGTTPIAVANVSGYIRNTNYVIFYLINLLLNYLSIIFNLSNYSSFKAHF